MKENKKLYALRTKSEIPRFMPNVGWAHDCILMRIDNPDTNFTIYPIMENLTFVSAYYKK